MSKDKKLRFEYVPAEDYALYHKIPADQVMSGVDSGELKGVKRGHIWLVEVEQSDAYKYKGLYKPKTVSSILAEYQTKPMAPSSSAPTKDKKAYSSENGSKTKRHPGVKVRRVDKGGWYELVFFIGAICILGGGAGSLLLLFAPSGAVMERYEMDFWDFFRMLGFGIMCIVLAIIWEKIAERW